MIEVSTTLEGGIRGTGYTAIRKTGNQFFDTANMIGVMMGNQDGIELQAVLGQVIENRLGLAGIDYQRLTAGRVGKAPDIVVTEGGYGGNGQHRAPHVLIECD